MQRTIRLFLLIEGIIYAVAGTIHSGALVAGYAHRQASIAERTIAIVLLGGFVLTWLIPAQMRMIGVAAQAFALLLTLVGAFTIAIGVGPQTAPNIAFHIAILAALVWGLFVAARQPSPDVGRRA